MEKRSTKQTIQALHTYMFKIADMIGSDDGVFTNGITIEDYEKLYHFSCALYTVHNQTHGEHLTMDMFSEAVLTFYASMFDKGLFENDEEIYTRAKNSFVSINEFLDSYLLFLKERKDPDALMHFVSAVIKHFPSCSNLGAFSVEGVNFSQLLAKAIETMSEDYTDLVAAWDKSLDHPASDDFIVETYPAEKQTNPAPVAAITTKKSNLPLIIAIIALLLSLALNIMLVKTGREMSAEYQGNLDNMQESQGDIYATANQLAEELESIKEEYLFLHEFAVVVVENNNYYHRFDCKTISLDNFWIHNKEFASSIGYRACRDCNPDNHGSLVIRENIESLIDKAPGKPAGPAEPY